MIRINYIYIYFNICFLCRWTQKEKAQREADEKAKQSPASSRAGTLGKDDKDKDDGNAATPPPKRSVIPTLTTSVTRPRGHPRKEPQPPTTDDKPKNASKEDMLWWWKKYNTAKWRCEKLTSDDAETYRQSENERVKKTRQCEREEIIAAAHDNSEVYKHLPDMPKSRAKEKSRRSNYM